MTGKPVRDLLNLLLYGGAFIGIGAACITALTFEVAGLAERHFPYILLIGTASAALYSAHKVIGIRKMDHIQPQGRFAVIRHYKSHIWLWCLLWTVMTIIIFRKWFDFNLLLWLVPGALIGLTYVIPLLPGGRRTRDLGWWKIVLIAMAWGWLTAFVPAAYFMEAAPVLAIIHGTERALFIFLITLPFEIRDQHIDASTDLKNLTYILGRKKTIGLAIGLVPLIMFLSFVSTFHYINPSYMISMTMTSVMTLFLLRPSYSISDDYYFSGLIDGLMIVALLMYHVVNVFV